MSASTLPPATRGPVSGGRAVDALLAALVSASEGIATLERCEQVAAEAGDREVAGLLSEVRRRRRADVEPLRDLLARRVRGDQERAALC